MPCFLDFSVCELIINTRITSNKCRFVVKEPGFSPQGDHNEK